MSYEMRFTRGVRGGWAHRCGNATTTRLGCRCGMRVLGSRRRVGARRLGVGGCGI